METRRSASAPGATDSAPPSAAVRPQLHRCWPRGAKNSPPKINKSPASSELAIMEICVSRTGRSRCPGIRLCAPGAAGVWAVSAVCVRGGKAWKQLLQHAAAFLSLGPSRAGRRAALAVGISQQGPSRDSSDVADVTGIQGSQHSWALLGWETKSLAAEVPT